MIFYANQSSLSTPTWLDNPSTEATVPFRFDLTTGELVRIEGRNLSTDNPTLVGFAYESGTVICPFFKQYRVTRVRDTAGAVWTDTQINRNSPAANSVRMSPKLQYRGRSATEGLRMRSRQVAYSLGCDLLPPSGTASDRALINSGTGAKDFTNCRSGTVQSGETEPYSIKVTSPVGSNGELMYDFRVSSGGAGAQDIAAGNNVWPTLFARFYVDPIYANTGPSGNSLLSQIIIGLQDTGAHAGNTQLANFLQVTSSACCGPGWQEVQAMLKPATVDPALIELFRLYVQPASGQQAAVTFDTFQFLKSDPTKKYVSFRDDDCFPDAGRTAKEFDKRGIRGTFFCKPGLIGTTASCSLADIRAFQASGHVIAHQGWSRYTDDEVGVTTINYYNQSPEEFFRKNIQQAMWWMQDNGFEQGARIFAPEQGNMSCEQRAYAYLNGIDNISQTNNAGGQASMVNHLSLIRNNYVQLYISGAANIFDELDYRGGLVVSSGHATTSAADANMAAVMARVMPSIKDGSYKCVTFAEIASGLIGD